MTEALLLEAIPTIARLIKKWAEPIPDKRATFKPFVSSQESSYSDLQ